MRRATGFCQEERGATAIEYALVGSLIALAIIAMVQLLGLSLSTFFETSASTVNAITNKIAE